jgi:hypothetical protein
MPHPYHHKALYEKCMENVKGRHDLVGVFRRRWESINPVQRIEYYGHIGSLNDSELADCCERVNENLGANEESNFTAAELARFSKE